MDVCNSKKKERKVLVSCDVEIDPVKCVNVTNNDKLKINKYINLKQTEFLSLSVKNIFVRGGGFYFI